MDQTYMKEQPVLKLIVSMALPMVISMMVSSLYNIVDSFFIARISEDAMTALSLVYPVQNLINAVMIGFGIGINAVISFYLGAQDKKMADRAATQGMLLGTIHGVGFMILGIAVMRPFLQMFTGNAQIVDYGVRYSRIAFLFATALSWQLLLFETLPTLYNNSPIFQHFLQIPILHYFYKYTFLLPGVTFQSHFSFLRFFPLAFHPHTR